jgi:hypothetical protein
MPGSFQLFVFSMSMPSKLSEEKHRVAACEMRHHFTDSFAWSPDLTEVHTVVFIGQTCFAAVDRHSPSNSSSRMAGIIVAHGYCVGAMWERAWAA